MRILLDEQLPRQLAPYFAGHDVRTTQEQGWAGLKNGALLEQALSSGFDVLVTGDKNLADEWVHLPNRNPIFSGQTPLAYMVQGGLPAMQTVRRLLDARRAG